MSLGINSAFSNLRHKVDESIHFAESLPGKIENEVQQGTRAAESFMHDAGETLSSLYASRKGISTAFHPLSFLNRLTSPPPDKPFDGHLIGVGGRSFPPNTPLSSVPAVTPKNGVTNNETLIYVNGIQTKVGGQAGSMQAIANASGSRVVGVHNATTSMIGDVSQSLGDKLDIGDNPAVDTLADTIYNELQAGRSPHVLAHSQGAIITSRAVQDVKNRLMLEDGMSRPQVEKLLNNVKIETFGGASRRFPDGPQYVHYVNRNDGVPQSFGLRSWLNPFAHAGRDSITHYFRAGKPVISHSFEDFYLPERVPFEQARQGKFN